MKNLLLFFVGAAMCLFANHNSNAQSTPANSKRIQVGMKLGLGMSTFHSSKYEGSFGFIPGGALGGFVRVGKSKHRGQVELVLSSRGASSSSYLGNDKCRTLHLDLPILYNFKLTNKVYLEIGMQTSLYLGNLKFISYTSDKSTIASPVNYYFTGFNKVDEFVIVGLGAEFNRLEVGIRGMYGLGKNNRFDPSFYTVIDTNDPIYLDLINTSVAMHSTSFCMTLGWKF